MISIYTHTNTNLKTVNRPWSKHVCHSLVGWLWKSSSSFARWTLEGGAMEPVWESLLFPAVDGNYYWVPAPWWVHTHKHARAEMHRHIHTPTDTRSNIRTQAESFTKDKRFPVGLRGRRREGEKSSSGSLLFFIHFLSPSALRRPSLLCPHSPVL